MRERRSFAASSSRMARSAEYGRKRRLLRCLLRSTAGERVRDGRVREKDVRQSQQQQAAAKEWREREWISPEKGIKRDMKQARARECADPLAVPQEGE